MDPSCRQIPLPKRGRRAYRAFSTFLWLSLFLLSFSCAGSPLIKNPEAARLIENVPFFPQEAYQCGPASLAGVLNYWKLNISPSDIAAEIFSKKAKGTLDADLLFYTEKKGLKGIQYGGNLKDLKRNIDSGFPLILLIDEGFWVYQKNHFMVLVGYNEKGIIVNSGKDQHRFIPSSHFMKTWERTKFWTLRIEPK